MRFINFPFLSRIIFPKIIKSFPNDKGKLFFTFDDGPDPKVTPLILDILRKYQVKASFFCLGENIEKYPKLFQKIKDDGHTVGNHGYKHLNGWKCSLNEFKENVEKGFQYSQSDLFRPPYGKLNIDQYFWIKRRYKIIAWDVMTYDFDPLLTEEDCYKIAVKHVKHGSIIVFHDNISAGEKNLLLLPKLIEHFLAKGCLFAAL